MNKMEKDMLDILKKLRQEYGAVIDPGDLELDLAASEALRAEMRCARGPRPDVRAPASPEFTAK